MEISAFTPTKVGGIRLAGAGNVLGHLGALEGIALDEGTGGLVPSFVGTGSLEALTPGQLSLTDARPGAFCILFGGLFSNPAPWEGGA